MKEKAFGLFRKLWPTLAPVCLAYRVHSMRGYPFTAHTPVLLSHRHVLLVVGPTPAVVIDSVIGALDGLMV